MSTKIQLSAIDPYLEVNIPERKESDSGKDFVTYGTDNNYPAFLFSLVENCATLSAIVAGITDYVLGNKVTGNLGMSQTELEEFIERTSADYLTFGQVYWQVIRSLDGNVKTLKWLDARYVRADKDNNNFWYSEEFGKKWGRTKAVVYPRFNPENIVPASVYTFKTPLSRGVYGTPIWQGALKDAVIQTRIELFHMNELYNNFTASAIISFNNGQPTDEEKKQLEKEIREKLGGAENAARFLLLFNDSKENATTIERLSTDDLPQRYDALAKRSREQLFIAFRATPNLFGLATESNGFNAEEYGEAFKLFQRTVIAPLQVRITSAVAEIFGEERLVIEQFSLLENNQEKTIE